MPVKSYSWMGKDGPMAILNASEQVRTDHARAVRTRDSRRRIIQSASSVLGEWYDLKAQREGLAGSYSTCSLSSTTYPTSPDESAEEPGLPEGASGVPRLTHNTSDFERSCANQVVDARSPSSPLEDAMRVPAEDVSVEVSATQCQEHPSGSEEISGSVKDVADIDAKDEMVALAVEGAMEANDIYVEVLQPTASPQQAAEPLCASVPGEAVTMGDGAAHAKQCNDSTRVASSSPKQVRPEPTHATPAKVKIPPVNTRSKVVPAPSPHPRGAPARVDLHATKGEIPRLGQRPESHRIVAAPVVRPPPRVPSSNAIVSANMKLNGCETHKDGALPSPHKDGAVPSPPPPQGVGPVSSVVAPVAPVVVSERAVLDSNTVEAKPLHLQSSETAAAAPVDEAMGVTSSPSGVKQTPSRITRQQMLQRLQELQVSDDDDDE